MFEYAVSHVEGLAIFATLVAGFIITVLRFFNFKSKSEIKQILKEEFDQVVLQLASEKETSRLSAAILLRRFYKQENLKKYAPYHQETIYVISSLLRTLPTGIFQKTLGDGLGYAVVLDHCDLQKTNLQDVLIKGSGNRPIRMNGTDLFMADLSNALFVWLNAENIVFYQANLYHATFKECNFKGGNFRQADLTSCRFKNVYLNEADFTGAMNIPREIEKYLVGGVVKFDGMITTQQVEEKKRIFFSMPGKMRPEDDILIRDFRSRMEAMGYEVVFYERKEYRNFGQVGHIRTLISGCHGVIVFGLKQLEIKQGVFRPSTNEREVWCQKWLPTPWNEIEMGMALMAGLPVLLVKDDEINLGLFDGKISEVFISVLSTNEDFKKLEENKKFLQWCGQVERTETLASGKKEE